MSNYNYSISSDTLNSKCDTSTLEHEIRQSAIVVALDSVSKLGDSLDLSFKSSLSTGDETLLTTIVNNHDGEPLNTAHVEVVRVLEEDDDPEWRTDGNYGSKGLTIDIPSGVGAYSKDFTFPYLISILSLEYVPSANMDGDNFTSTIGPETTLGVITADVSASDTVIHVPKAIINRRKLKTGRIIHLDDGTNKDAIGEIIAVSKKDGTITVDVGATHAFSASTPTYIKSTILMANAVPLRGTVKWDLGESKIGGSPLPPTTVIHFEYENLTGTAKTFSALLQYLY